VEVQAFFHPYAKRDSRGILLIPRLILTRTANMLVMMMGEKKEEQV
jgi:hypothetical protein